MSERIKFDWQGRQVDAVRVEVNSSSETFITHTLEDGTTLRLKAVVVDVLRLVDIYDEEGDPIYVVKSKNILSIRANQALRKPRGGQ